jgi:hypothetical protein
MYQNNSSAYNSMAQTRAQKPQIALKYNPLPPKQSQRTTAVKAYQQEPTQAQKLNSD